MDAIDRQILAELQRDATLSLNDIAQRVGLSSTPCWRRIKRLEQSGVIRERVALLDGAKLNVGTTVFVSVKAQRHTDAWLAEFTQAVAGFPEVVELYRMSGEVDYLLRVVVPDIAAYDAFYKRLRAAVDVGDMTSSFAMEEIKYTTALPLTYAE
ncbi:MAG: Lrp/AsnC family transcriptional regulator [Alphaproteobacteria bacterium]|nr:Lrp/AsnC family transcriptional regulator [Alphaproteobacteria bacterium]